MIIRFLAVEMSRLAEVLREKQYLCYFRRFRYIFLATPVQRYHFVFQGENDPIPLSSRLGLVRE